MNTKVYQTGYANLRGYREYRTWFAKTVDWIVSLLKKRQKQRQDRAAFETMLRLDDRLLNDVGVTRYDVEWASNLPLSFNAADELRKISSKVGRIHN